MKKKYNFCYGVIYQVINIQNRKSYVGYTSQKDFMKYINEHFDNALLEYGRVNE